MKIYLLRHGETDWNREGRLQGHKDILMNEHGVMQMKEVGSYIHNNKLEVDIIISSPLRRAKMSAEIVATKIGYLSERIILEPLFIERSFGIAEGLTKEERRNLSDEECGMESIEMLCERAKMGINKYIETDNGQSILVVAHGALLKAVVVALTGGRITYDDDRVEIKQGGLLLLEYEKGKVADIHQHIRQLLFY